MYAYKRGNTLVKRILRVRSTLLLAALLLLLFFTLTFSAQLLGYEPIKSEIGVQRQVSESTLDITVWVFLSERYKFFDLNIRDEVVVNITTSLTEPPATPYVISTVLSFSFTEVTDLPPGAYYTYGFWGLPPVGILNIYLPANTSYSSIKLKGHLSGSSVFWRNTAEIFFLNVSSPIADTSSYRLILVPPSPSRILKVYSYSYPNLLYQETETDGQKHITVYGSHPGSPIVILYEPKNWEIYAIILMVTLVLMVYAVPYTIKSEKVGAKLSHLIAIFRRLLPKLIFLKQLRAKVSELNPSNFLKVYILCALLMVSLSFIVGPCPCTKVYVLASTPENARTISDFVYGEVGGVAITVYDEMNEFDTLTNLGVFSAVIVGNFYPPSNASLRGYVYPGLDSVSRIIIVERYAYEVFSSEVRRRYSEKTVVVGDLGALGPALRGIPERKNLLGLDISYAFYSGVSAFVGLCSFVIVFLGLAFLSSKLIEMGKKPNVTGFPEAIMYSVFIFIFTQTVYIVCSVLLAMPLGLHTSTLKVTAVGFLGFAGGSRPRMLAGFFGFLLGALTSMKEGPKLDKTGFAAFLVLVFFLLVDPLTGGVIFYEFVLTFTVGPSIEYAVLSDSYVRMFLGSIIESFGGWISPVYAASTGIVLYYTGAVSFCSFPKLKNKTAVVFLFLSAFCISLGVVRVADMRPWKTISCVIPGLIVALFFAAFFYLLSRAEVFISKIAERMK